MFTDPTLSHKRTAPASPAALRHIVKARRKGATIRFFSEASHGRILEATDAILAHVHHAGQAFLIYADGFVSDVTPVEVDS